VLPTMASYGYNAAPAQVSTSLSGEDSRLGGRISLALRALAMLPMFRQDECRLENA
jgi:hypothetical protein